MQLTQNYLKECLDYNQDTGIFTWKERPLSHFKNESIMNNINSRFAGKQAGTINGGGYIQIQLKGIFFKAHRLAWFYIYGYMPENDTDHISSIRSDNRICNLREANRSENCQKLKKAKSGMTSTGLLGVSYNKKQCSFYSRIQINKNKKFLGYFKTPEEAHNAYLQAKRQLHPFGEI